MKFINLIILASTISSDTLFAENILSVEDAARKGYIKLVIKGKGGYSGEVVSMKIKNLTNEPLKLKVEAGRRLDSEKEEQQDLLVMRAEQFALGAKEEHTYTICGMCCQAGNHCPQLNSAYRVGKLADSNLVKLATFISRNKYYTDGSAQQAVWAISDNNSIGSISGDDAAVKIRKYVSDITGRPIPAYTIRYKQQDDTNPMGRAVQVEGVFSYTLNIDNKVTIGIYNSEGKLMQALMDKYPHARGDYKLS